MMRSLSINIPYKIFRPINPHDEFLRTESDPVAQGPGWFPMGILITSIAMQPCQSHRYISCLLKGTFDDNYNICNQNLRKTACQSCCDQIFSGNRSCLLKGSLFEDKIRIALWKSQIIFRFDKACIVSFTNINTNFIKLSYILKGLN